MKFLCVECDEAMKLKETRGPHDGSMTVIFGCPSCGREIAMLTNAMETQLVRSLDVKLGGRSIPAEPMEMLKKSLAHQREGILTSPEHSKTSEPPTEKDAGSKCPFSGTVSDAYAVQNDTLTWTAGAEKRLEGIPAYVRAMVKKSIEQHALENGCREIDEAVIDELKGKLGI